MTRRQVKAMSIFLAAGVLTQSACLLGYILAGRTDDVAFQGGLKVYFFGVTAALFWAGARCLTWRQLLGASLGLASLASISLQALGHIWFQGIFKDVDFYSCWNLRNFFLDIGLAFSWYAFLSAAWSFLLWYIRERRKQERETATTS